MPSGFPWGKKGILFFSPWLSFKGNPSQKKGKKGATGQLGEGSFQPCFPTIVLFEHRSFPWVSGGFLPRRIPGKNGEGSTRVLSGYLPLKPVLFVGICIVCGHFNHGLRQVRSSQPPLICGFPR